jgi:hypothetical protein
VADGSLGFVLMGASHVMKIGSNFQDLHVCAFSLSNMHAKIIDPTRMLPIVTSSGVRKTFFRKCLYVLYGQRHESRSYQINFDSAIPNN